jgi:hypothetical protein
MTTADCCSVGLHRNYKRVSAAKKIAVRDGNFYFAPESLACPRVNPYPGGSRIRIQDFLVSVESVSIAR